MEYKDIIEHVNTLVDVNQYESPNFETIDSEEETRRIL